jgi:hypothetical protein
VNPEGERWKGESEAVPPPKRVVMAKSSMVASTIPKKPIHHGNRDAYIYFPFFEFWKKMIYNKSILLCWLGKEDVTHI